MKKIIISRFNNEKIKGINNSSLTVSFFYLKNLIDFGFYIEDSNLSKKIESKIKINRGDIDKDYLSAVTYLQDEQKYEEMLDEFFDSDAKTFWVENTLLNFLIKYLKKKEIEVELEIHDKYKRESVKKISNKALSSLIGICSKFHYKQLEQVEKIAFGKFQDQLIINDTIRANDSDIIEIKKILNRLISLNSHLPYQNFLNKTLVELNKY